MEQTIQEELILMLKAILLGIRLILRYELLELFRQLVKHKNRWISMEDLIYWISNACTIFLWLQKETFGILRAYVLLGIMAGTILWLCLKKQLKKLGNHFNIKAYTCLRKRKAGREHGKEKEKEKK